MFFDAEPDAVGAADLGDGCGDEQGEVVVSLLVDEVHRVQAVVDIECRSDDEAELANDVKRLLVVAMDLGDHALVALVAREPCGLLRDGCGQRATRLGRGRREEVVRCP